MGQVAFNISLGRQVEFYSRVYAGEAEFVLLVLANAGLESDATLKTKDSISDVLSGTTNEVTNASYVRKILQDVDLAVYDVDDSLGQITLPFPTQTWTTIGVGDLWRKLVVGYDADPVSGTDSDILPVTAHDLLIDGVAVTPTGDDILVSFPTGWAIAR